MRVSILDLVTIDLLLLSHENMSVYIRYDIDMILKGYMEPFFATMLTSVIRVIGTLSGTKCFWYLASTTCF